MHKSINFCVKLEATSSEESLVEYRLLANIYKQDLKIIRQYIAYLQLSTNQNSIIQYTNNYCNKLRKIKRNKFYSDQQRNRRYFLARLWEISGSE